MQKFVLKSRIENLNPLMLKMDEALEGREVSAKSKMQLELMIEEVFVNICSYAYEDEGDIEILYEILDNPSAIRISFIDEGIEFNPLNVEEPDLTLDLEERDIGGLGLTLIRNISDKLDYRYEDNRNILTVEKKL